MTERTREVGGIVSFNGDRRIEDITLTITESGDAIADVELAGGDVEQIVFTRNQAEAFREQIAASYEAHDESGTEGK